LLAVLLTSGRAHARAAQEEIGKSLSQSAKSFDGDALSSFRLIQQFMGDVPSKKPAPQLARALVQMGAGEPRLRDEILCQLIKQLTDNPVAASRARGWLLAAFCLCNFAPTRGESAACGPTNKP
jgi:hypothetical protein